MVEEEEEEAWTGVAIIEHVDSDNEKLGLSSRLKASFSEYKDGKVDCFKKWVDGILELIVGNEVQEMKPIKEEEIKLRFWWR